IVTPDKKQSNVLTGVALAVVSGVTFLGWTLWRADVEGRREHQRALAMSATRFPAPPQTPMVMDGYGGHVRTLLLNHHPASSSPRVRAKVDTMLERQRATGWEVVEDDPEAEAELRMVLPPGGIGSGEALPVVVRQALARHDYDGYILVRALPGDGTPEDRMQ